MWMLFELMHLAFLLIMCQVCLTLYQQNFSCGILFLFLLKMHGFGNGLRRSLLKCTGRPGDIAAHLGVILGI